MGKEEASGGGGGLGVCSGCRQVCEGCANIYSRDCQEETDMTAA